MRDQRIVPGSVVRNHISNKVYVAGRVKGGWVYPILLKGPIIAVEQRVCEFLAPPDPVVLPMPIKEWEKMVGPLLDAAEPLLGSPEVG